MSDDRHISTSRREFLILTSASMAALWASANWPSAVALAHEVSRNAALGEVPFLFFTPEQAVEVEAMAAHIIPSDGTPGAREAHVIHFIDGAVSSFEHERQGVYAPGLKMLAAKVSETFPGVSNFSRLDTAQQQRVLKMIENTEFFQVVRMHTVMGFVSNPEYGGNADQVGWKHIGFEHRPFFTPPFGYYDRDSHKG